MADSSSKPMVGVIMGSKSDYEFMAAACEVMSELQVPHEVRVMSAHRTPDVVLDYSATARERGLRVIIAGAGGAAHLAGVVAAKTTLPVIGVPMTERAQRTRLAAVDRADAQRRAGRDDGDRKGRRRKCRTVRGRDSRAERRSTSRPAHEMARGARAGSAEHQASLREPCARTISILPRCCSTST